MEDNSKPVAAHSTTSYFAAYGTLVLLTIATVGLSFCPLANWHTAVGLAIASCKAVLVVIFFMHFLRSAPVSRLALFAGLLWFAILIGLTLTDYLTRHWLIY